MFLTISFCSEFLVNIIQCYEATKSMTINPTNSLLDFALSDRPYARPDNGQLTSVGIDARMV